MFQRKKFRSLMAGAAAGAVNGLFGAGGGMVLVPLLSRKTEFTEAEVFSSSVLIILPMCLITLGIGSGAGLPWKAALPFLLGSIPGGLLAALAGRHIPVKWLHRFLGVMILYGGWRYLC